MAEKQSTSSPESIRQDHFISSYIIMVRLLSSFGDWSVFCFRSKRSAWLKLELGCGGEGESVGLRERMCLLLFPERGLSSSTGTQNKQMATVRTDADQRAGCLDMKHEEHFASCSMKRISPKSLCCWDEKAVVDLEHLLLTLPLARRLQKIAGASIRAALRERGRA